MKKNKKWNKLSELQKRANDAECSLHSGEINIMQAHSELTIVLIEMAGLLKNQIRKQKRNAKRND